MTEWIVAYHGTADISQVMALGIRPVIGGIWLTTDLGEARAYARVGLDEQLRRGRGGVVRVRIPSSWVVYSRTGGPYHKEIVHPDGSKSIVSSGAEPNWYNMPKYSRAPLEGWMPDQPVEGETWYKVLHEIPPNMLERVY